MQQCRTLYCLELLWELDLKIPLSMTGVLHGMLSVAGVPQAAPKSWAAVLWTLVKVRLVGLYLFSSCTSGLLGRTELAKETKAGSSKVRTELPLEASER